MSDMDPRERGAPVMLGSKPKPSGDGFSLWDLVPDMGSSAASVTAGLPEFGKRTADNAKKIITDGALGDYPGYGTLWTYDAASGAQIQTKGWMALGGAVVVLYFVLKG